MCMSEIDDIALHGPEPVKAAIKFLQSYDFDDDISGVTLEFETAEDRQATQSEFSTGSDVSSSSDSPDDDPVVGPGSPDFVDEGPEKDEREQGDIQAETSHHWVLYLLGELGGEERYVPGKRVKEAAENTHASDSSIYPALTVLYERMITERQSRGGSYAYKLTDYGLKLLDEFGAPEEAETDNNED